MVQKTMGGLLARSQDREFPPLYTWSFRHLAPASWDSYGATWWMLRLSTPVLAETRNVRVQHGSCVRCRGPPQISTPFLSIERYLSHVLVSAVAAVFQGSTTTPQWFYKVAVHLCARDMYIYADAGE